MVSDGSQINYCWILKLLSGPRIFKFLNVCGNQNISIPELLMSLFFLFLGKILYSNGWIWNDIGRNCLLRHKKRNLLFAGLPSSMVTVKKGTRLVMKHKADCACGSKARYHLGEPIHCFCFCEEQLRI